MALTAQLKEELAAVKVIKIPCRKAEVAAMLRYSNALQRSRGSTVVEAEVDCEPAADRLEADIAEMYGYHPERIEVQPGGIRRAPRYVLRYVTDGDALARQTGLLDKFGRPTIGLDPQLLRQARQVAAHVWRGAFLVAGSLTEPGRSMSLEVTCPGSETALALVNCARHLGVVAKSREVRDSVRIVIKDGEAISSLLGQMGAHETRLIWEERRARREVRGTANRLANFDDANIRRSARAAVAAGAKVRRAFEILGPDVPTHLREAGELRIAHKEASLEE
ncbi:MAG: DNA-binding protein WhiA, partial [Promicromonosporaceae bacterium]|nr:DNA-binding protein WhiA [Promicromonosporaceae bacterium]